MARIESNIPIEAEDDLRTSLTLSNQGSNLKPDYDQENNALLFPQNNESEIAYTNGQFSHSIKPNCDIQPHVHVLLDSAVIPKFKILYRILNLGQAPTAWVEYLMDLSVLPYGSGEEAHIIKGASRISGLTLGESSIIQCKLYIVTGDGYSGDVKATDFDIHYMVEKFGRTFT